jgi:hypothetical protein
VLRTKNAPNILFYIDSGPYNFIVLGRVENNHQRVQSSGGHIMKLRKFGTKTKIGICILLFSFILFPMWPSITMAEDGGTGAASGGEGTAVAAGGSGAAPGQAEAAGAAAAQAGAGGGVSSSTLLIAAAIAAAIAIPIAIAASEDEEGAVVTPPHH